MPTLTRMSGRVRHLAPGLLSIGVCIGIAAGWASAGTGAGANQELAVRAVVPARIAGRPTAVVAARALASQSWPVAGVDSVRGVMASQWLYFKQGPLGGTCWIRVRLVALPVSGDTTTTLGAQVWLVERVGTGAAMAYARSVFDAYRKDVLAATEAGRGVHGNLQSVLSYTDGDFVVCGAHAQPQ